MKKTFFPAGIVLAGVLSVPVHALAQSAPAPGSCAAKEQEIARELEQARKNDHRRQAAGLEKALSKVRRHCDDGAVATKRREELSKKRAEVKERERELRASRQSGDDREKIQRRTEKLAQEQQELSALEQRYQGLPQ